MICNRKQNDLVLSDGINTEKAARILLFWPLLEQVKPANLVGIPTWTTHETFREFTPLHIESILQIH